MGGTYLDCGCYIDTGGHRHWCPMCANSGPGPDSDTIADLRRELAEAVALQLETDKLHAEEAAAWKRELEETRKIASNQVSDLTHKLAAVTLENARLREIREAIMKLSEEYAKDANNKKIDQSDRAWSISVSNRIAEIIDDAALAVVPADGLGASGLREAIEKLVEEAREKEGDDRGWIDADDLDALLAELGARP
jgi:hypothetical protein